MRTLVALAATLRMRRDPAFRAPAVDGNPQAAAIDGRVQSLAGSPHLREAIEAGTPPAEIAAGWRAYEAAFRERVAPVLMYPE